MFMTKDGEPKFLTKRELRVVAIRQLDASKGSFDFAWIDTIETNHKPVARTGASRFAAAHQSQPLRGSGLR